MEKVKNARSERIISPPLEILLRIFGIWPGASINLFCKVFWMLVNIYCIFSQYLFLIIRLKTTDLSALTYAFSASLAFSVKCIKLMVFWFHQRKFDDMWRTVSTNWKRSDTDFNAGATTGGGINLSHYLPNIVVAFNSISITMFTFGTLENGINYDENSNLTRPYVLMMYLPFDSTTQSTYLLVIFVQFFYSLILCAGTVTINAVLIILTRYLGDQVDIVRKNMTEIFPSDNECKIERIAIRDIIKKHQRIIVFAENIESLYTYIALTLLIFNPLITCILGFILVTAIGKPNCVMIIAKNLMFYCVVIIETFVFCFAGEYISTKSREIGDAAYNSSWYRSKYHSRIIFILIMRSQNQLTITMGKFMVLSLEQFANIIKASTSYVSVLLALY